MQPSDYCSSDLKIPTDTFCLIRAWEDEMLYFEWTRNIYLNEYVSCSWNEIQFFIFKMKSLRFQYHNWLIYTLLTLSANFNLSYMTFSLVKLVSSWNHFRLLFVITFICQIKNSLFTSIVITNFKIHFKKSNGSKQQRYKNWTKSK